MRKGEEFINKSNEFSQDGRLLIDRSKDGVEEVARPSADSTIQRDNAKQTGRRTGRTLACLLGAFLVVFTMLGAPAVSSAHISIGFSVGFGPPALPYYAQPPCPGPGYIWTPGYWAWDPGYGYYWVPGTWVPAPFIGAMWTPGYWYFSDDAYRWSPGYWGLSVGYYGGIDYGFGYDGDGYRGGYWDHDRFYYNRAVNRIEGRDFSHVYYRREDNRFRYGRASFHGGPGGTFGGPTRQQMAARRMRRFGPLGDQVRQQQFARRDPVERASFNHGRPGIAATPMPGMFRGHGVERASRPGVQHAAPVVRMNNRQGWHPAPARNQNWQHFQRAQSYRAPHNNAQRYAAQRGQFQRGHQRQYVQRQMPQRNFQRGPQRQYVQRQRPQRNFQRGPQRQYVQRQMPQRHFQRGPYQARRQEMQRPQRYSAPRHFNAPQRQQYHGGGRGQDHGRGGRH